MRQEEVSALRWRVYADRGPTARRVANALSDGRTAADLLGKGLEDLAPDVAHLCVRRLRIDVRMRVSPDEGDGQIRRLWTEAARPALREQLAAMADGDVAVYRRPQDAAADLVRSLAKGDTRRAWAWRQCGLLPGPAPSTGAGRSRAVAAALLVQPELAPAVLAAVEAPVVVPLELAAWLRVARVWAASVASPGEPVRTVAGETPVRPGTAPVPPGVAPVPPGVVAAALRSAAGRGLMPHREGVRRLDEDARLALARLVIAGSVPERLRDPRICAAVVEALCGDGPAPPPATATARPATPSRAAAGRAPDSEPESAPLSERDSEPFPGPFAPPEYGRGQVRNETTSTAPADDDSAALAGAEAAERLFTRNGGLLFLAGPIGRLIAPDLRPEDLPGAVIRLCQGLTDVGPDDPVLTALAGPPPGLPPAGLPPDPARAGPDDHERVRLIRSWLLDRLRTPGDGDDDNLDWLWRRPALIEVTPGWIDAEFSLDDVDLRIRRAQLDLDPGWLWWRGAVMRFRYV
ncbi:hypothetical protein [Actinoplanes sp. M2I2]|uniref:hypothetical protein n=1 Tax=Actinoplanes sp. M2I2 TaxID=1734444 RepID=UPI0020221B32|nr:hypothetical protein [Actinoplanes sp. M2I2]